MADAKHFRHISDIDVWLTPDRNYFVFILLSVFGGFLALDHFYLRSFDTAAQKLIYNFLGFGIWYFWDLIQIFTDNQKVRKEGLSSPFDWIQGIGRGVFKEKEDENQLLPKKSYIIWAFLTIFGGIFALDKFYIGDTFHGVLKVVSVFSVVFTLFGIFWVAWDAIHAFFMTKDVLADKISLPFPLTYFGLSETDGDIFLPKEPIAAGSWFPLGNPFFSNAFKDVGPDKVSPAIKLALGTLAQNSLTAVAGEKGAKDLQSIATGVSAALPGLSATMPKASI
jgi:TM2 domain-containing membrane protein YozV